MLRRRLIFFSATGVGLTFMVILSAGMGATYISPMQIISILLQKVNLPAIVNFTDQQEAIFLSIRSPRVTLAVLVGMALAVSGASLQGLFRNPLADPGIIGVSSGAVAAVVCLLFFSTALGQIMSPNALKLIQPIAGFLGGSVSTLLVYSLATTGKYTDMTSMLLGGIAIGTLSSALVGIFIFMSDDNQLRSITFWLLGSISGATWSSIITAGPIILLSTFILALLGSHLNALSLGDNVAFHIGVRVESSKRLVIILACCATGAAVCISGMIGFIGLVAPHIVRLSIGADHKFLVPTAALLGSFILLLADLLARTLASPAEIPLGVVTSLIGAPFFLWLVFRNKTKVGSYA